MFSLLDFCSGMLDVIFGDDTSLWKNKPDSFPPPIVDRDASIANPVLIDYKVGGLAECKLLEYRQQLAHEYFSTQPNYKSGRNGRYARASTNLRVEIRRRSDVDEVARDSRTFAHGNYAVNASTDRGSGKRMFDHYTVLFTGECLCIRSETYVPTWILDAAVSEFISTMHGSNE